MMPTIASTTANTIPTGERMDGPEDRENSRRRNDSEDGGEDCIRGLGPGRKSDGGMTLAVAAKEYIWLYDFRHGMNEREIAAHNGTTVRQVRKGIKRARALDTKLTKESLVEELRTGRLGDVGFRLTPLFPIASFTPQSACPHHKPLERGSSFCCMVCHSSGMDGHPGLRRDSLSDPSPESKPAPVPDSVAPSKSDVSQETRKQRRRRLFAEAVAAQAKL
jgi:hypothetical protein